MVSIGTTFAIPNPDMSARYIPAQTAKIVDGLKALLGRQASDLELIEYLFKVLKDDCGWETRLNDLFRRHRPFWSIQNECDIAKLDMPHQAMFTLIAKCDPDWLRRFLEILSTAKLPAATRALFAVLLVGLETNHLFHPILFQDEYCRMMRSAPTPPFPCAFNSDTFCARLSKSYELTMPCAIMEAIATDNLSLFEIHRTLHNKTFTRSLVKTLFKHSACKIITRHIDTAETFIDPKDILFFCASTLPPSCIRLIEALESRHPGLVANSRDIFGNNALWYGLHRLGENRCDPEVEKRLIELGCDPKSPNHLDLSYASMLKAKEYLKAI